ncbi:MAG: glycosyltransferase, partial [Promethearchaeota archaeon]
MKGKIIILIYQTYVPYQGRYPRTAGHAKILKENGFDVTVLACDREGSHPANEILEGIRVRRIPIETGEMLGPFRQVFPLLLFWIKSVKWLLTHQFDILHCHNLDVLPVGCFIRVFRRRPVLFDSHEPNYYALWPDKWKPFLQLINLLEKLMVMIVDAVSVTNHYQVQKYKKVGARRVELIGNYPLPHLRVDKLREDKHSKDHAVFGRLGTIYP